MEIIIKMWILSSEMWGLYGQTAQGGQAGTCYPANDQRGPA